MRARLVVALLGALLFFVGLSMLVPVLLALLYREEDLTALLASAVASIAVGGALFLVRPRKEGREIGAREGFAIVTLGWVSSCIAGALPFWLYAHVPPLFFADAPARAADEAGLGHEVPRQTADCTEGTGIGVPFCSFTNAAFESFSGFTTTGSSVLSRDLWPTPDSRAGGLPHGLLFWRALTHWLGGMGIIVLGIAILPLLGVGGMQLYKAEVPGPTADKLTPRVTQTAKLLWTTYALMSLVEVILLMMGGQDAFMATCHTFATMATGGFSPLRDSLAGVHSPYAEWVVTVFMLLSGMNFAHHYKALTRRFDGYTEDPEVRFYLVVTLAATALLALALAFGDGPGGEAPVRNAAFQVVSILTTTGFCSADWGQWVPLAQMTLFALFFIGGMAGSTGGGIKCARIWVMTKQAYTELFHLIHPRAVTPVRLSGRRVDGEVLRSVSSFVFLYLFLYLVSTLALTVSGMDLITAIGAVGACLGNIGPGLGGVGAAQNYEWIDPVGKWILVACMLLGRLEVYTVLVLFTPEYWRR